MSERLGDLKGRGVVLREGQTLWNLFDERTPLYDKYADIVVNEAGMTVEETLDAVVEGLKKLGIAPGDRSKRRKK